MKSKRRWISLWTSILALLVILPTSPASALGLPEKLVYDVSWSGLTAGTAVQEVTVKDGALHILYTVHSSGLVNSFFFIDDKTESVLSADDPYGVPRIYRERINEGKTHTWKEARFDLAKLQVETRDFLKKTEKTDPISAKTFDTLSVVQHLRSRTLTPGELIQLDIFDCKRLWSAEVQVVKREEIDTPLGTFKTIVVKAVLRAPGVKPRNDYLTVWLSDDKLRVPVRLAVNLKVGQFIASLAAGSHWK